MPKKKAKTRVPAKKKPEPKIRPATEEGAGWDDDDAGSSPVAEAEEEEEQEAAPEAKEDDDREGGY